MKHFVIITTIEKAIIADSFDLACLTFWATVQRQRSCQKFITSQYIQKQKRSIYIVSQDRGCPMLIQRKPQWTSLEVWSPAYIHLHNYTTKKQELL